VQRAWVTAAGAQLHWGVVQHSPQQVWAGHLEQLIWGQLFVGSQAQARYVLPVMKHPLATFIKVAVEIFWVVFVVMHQLCMLGCCNCCFVQCPADPAAILQSASRGYKMQDMFPKLLREGGPRHVDKQAQQTT
jgi:hypothetical protein